MTRFRLVLTRFKCDLYEIVMIIVIAELVQN